MLQRTLLKFRKSNPRTCWLRFGPGLMKRKLPVFALLLPLGLNVQDRVQTNSASAGSSASGRTSAPARLTMNGSALDAMAATDWPWMEKLRR